MILDISQFFSLRHTLPVVDVRSEGEFGEGHIPGAVNIPLLNNEERIVVGTCYKQRGQKEAIAEGFRLVGPRLHQILQDADRVGNEMIVHCWRGGMRSMNFCQFAGMAGIKTHQVKGGYKAYRQYGLDYLARPFRLKVLTGLTGSGKSEILRELQLQGHQVIDLESMASHKGSVFGGLGLPPQPTTEQFHNELFECMLRFDESKPVWVEDESIAIGKVFMPQALWRNMNTAPVIRVDVPLEVRVRRLVSEYRLIPPEIFYEAMKGIVKRLGGQNFNEAAARLFAGDLAGAIEILLSYYDKAYNNGLERKRGRISHTIPWNGDDIVSFASSLGELDFIKEDRI